MWRRGEESEWMWLDIRATAASWLHRSQRASSRGSAAQVPPPHLHDDAMTLGVVAAPPRAPRHLQQLVVLQRADGAVAAP